MDYSARFSNRLGVSPLKDLGSAKSAVRKLNKRGSTYKRLHKAEKLLFCKPERVR